MTASGLIEVALHETLGQFVLDAAFTLPARGVIALFGPSGCGKTTVLRCLAGLTRVGRGRCVVDGDVWQDGKTFRPPHRRDIGYVFQEASLFPHLSVRGNLLYGAPRRMEAASGNIPAFAFDDVVALLGLAPFLDRAPRHLSGGERQRVAIGRALLSRPRLLLMDEPLSALDRPTREDILPFIERLHESFAIPVVYVSHDMTEVERLADSLVLMKGGRVLAAGPLHALQSDPALPLAASRDAAVSLDADVVDLDQAYGLATLAVGSARFFAPALGTAVGQRRRVSIAAGDVSLSRRPQRDSTILNSLPVRIVTATRVADHEILAVLSTGAEPTSPRLLARVTRRSWELLKFVEGDTVHAQIKSVALVPFRRKL